ncbi:STM2901 family protein [Erwinia sp.]|uniref:STM2901 family protein n=1 Tax=Erwinia citreus TaxID=558 RepID=UPI00289FC825|nr:hypothetical protein [Erwinia sp.]
MDTVEELNNTYYYAGRSNLTACELLFMIFCEKTIEQLGLGIEDTAAVVAIVSGRNNIPTRAKPGGAIKNTSIALMTARRVFKKAKFPFMTKLPTIVGHITKPKMLKIRMVANIGTFVGRSVPVLGWAILASDVSQITWNTIRDYNSIARGDDKIW